MSTSEQDLDLRIAAAETAVHLRDERVVGAARSVSRSVQEHQAQIAGGVALLLVLWLVRRVRRRRR